MKQSKSCFQGLKAGALICAGCFGPLKSQILGPQTAFEGYMLEGTVRDALTYQGDRWTNDGQMELML
jgi:hypothetical protein